MIPSLRVGVAFVARHGKGIQRRVSECVASRPVVKLREKIRLIVGRDNDPAATCLAQLPPPHPGL